MNESTKGNLKSLFAGIAGAIIVLFFVVLFGVIIFENNPIKENDNNNNQKIEKTDVGRIYDDAVDSVISVINLQKVKVDNWLIQEFIDSKTNGNPVEQGIGSGFVYKKEDGYYYAVTNNHVIEGSDKLGILTSSAESDEDLIDTELIGSNTLYDVAVIRFKTNLDIPILEFSDSDKIYPGENVYAIGSPYGTDFKGSITSGIVSAPIRKVETEEGEKLEYIQTDAAINPGNSGGPLIDDDAKVVGMNTMKIAEVEADNIGFSIPSNAVQKIIQGIEEKSLGTSEGANSSNSIFDDEENIGDEEVKSDEEKNEEVKKEEKGEEEDAGDSLDSIIGDIFGN